MTFGVTAKIEGFDAALTAVRVKARMAALRGITRAEANLKSALREQVTAAGFSDRLAKTWQGKVYPNDGKNPAAFVFSKAPKIIDSYARGATIVATGGRRALAIPTDQTPMARSGGRGRQGRSKTPAEVEQQFGRKLRFVPAQSTKGVRARGAAGAGTTIGYLVMDALVAGSRTGRLRNASARQLKLAGTGKASKVQGVVMFVLVRQVRKPKLFDLQGTAEAIGATVPQLIAQEWGE